MTSDNDSSEREMVTTGAYQTTRVRGLTVDQRRFLGARPLYATDVECCRALRPPLYDGAPKQWRQDSPLFAAAYDTLWDDGIEYAKAETRRLLGLGVQRIEALLTAESPVRTKFGVATRTVVDSETGEQREEPVTAPDWQAQAKGAEMLLRANGLWNPPTAADSGNTVAIEAIRLMAQLVERRSSQPQETITVIDVGNVQPRLTDGAVPDGGTGQTRG